MNLFWRESEAGLNLIMERDNGDQTRVGYVLRTERGFDALAQTYGDSPENSKVDLATLEEAQAFVEMFTPWQEFGGAWALVVEPGVRPRPS
jgi:hypothetical protein